MKWKKFKIKTVTDADGLAFADDGSGMKAEAGSGEYCISFEK